MDCNRQDWSKIKGTVYREQLARELYRCLVRDYCEYQTNSGVGIVFCLEKTCVLENKVNSGKGLENEL